MKKLLTALFIGLSLCLPSIINAQGVGINNLGYPPDSSAMLDVSSTTKGTLITRMTTAQRNAINNPAEGLMIFNTTTKCFEAYVYSTWSTISCPCPSIAAPTAASHTASPSQITWNWNTASGASGYKYNTVNNYSTATDNNTSTAFTQTQLNCGSSYTLYVWSYNACTISTVTALTQSTPACPSCGSQVWASANLNAGTMVSTTSNHTNNGTAEKYCYNNIEANCSIYGGLYMWDEMMNYTSSTNCDPCGSGGSQGLCPAGYHIPTDFEWSRYEYCIENTISPTGFTSLSDFQNGSTWRGSTTGAGPGDKMKVTSSGSPSWNGTNTSGFGALPAGYRNSNATVVGNVGTNAFIWSATQFDGTTSWLRQLDTDHTQTWRFNVAKDFSASVRCLKD